MDLNVSMTPRFSSLSLLSVLDDTIATDRRRIVRLYRNRCVNLVVSGVIGVLFSLIPGTFFYLASTAPADPVDFPSSVKWTLILFTGGCFFVACAITFLIFRQIWVDPFRLYLQNPKAFDLGRGQLVGGKVDWNSEGRHQGFGWTGEIKYTIDKQSHTLFESFSRNIVLDQNNWLGKKKQGLVSHFPVEAWVIRHRDFKGNSEKLRKFSLNGIFWQDVNWVLRRAWHGPKDALVGLDSKKIERIPQSLRTSYTEIKWGAFIVFFFIVALFFFALPMLPGIPDGRWLEVSHDLPKMKELKISCDKLKADFAISSPERTKNLLETSALAEDWFKQIQYTAWNINFEKLSAEEQAKVHEIFFEDCREKVLTENALKYISEKSVQKIILAWLDDIAKYPRSVARLEMAKTLARELARRFGTPEEQRSLEQWSDSWGSNDPQDLQSLKEVIRWIQRQGSHYAEWQYPFQGRVLQTF